MNINKILLVISLIAVFFSGFFVRSFFYRNKDSVNKVEIADSVHISIPKIMAEIQSKKIDIQKFKIDFPSSDSSSIFFPPFVDGSATYEIAIADTVFAFLDGNRHHIRIEYDELYNTFKIDSIYHVKTSVFFEPIPDAKKKSKLKIEPYLGLYMAFGENDNVKSTDIGAFIGIKVKSFGIGFIATNNNTVGGIVSVYF